MQRDIFPPFGYANYIEIPGRCVMFHPCVYGDYIYIFYAVISLFTRSKEIYAHEYALYEPKRTDQFST